MPTSQVLVMAANLLAASGISGYRIDPPDSEDGPVTWTLANGVVGGPKAIRNYDGEAEEAATSIIHGFASDCKGQFISTEQSIPTHDRSIVRKVVAAIAQQTKAA